MGICKDESTAYLQRLGYNVVRHPQEGIKPPHLIGRQRGTTSFLGSLDQLITNPSGSFPAKEEKRAPSRPVPAHLIAVRSLSFPSEGIRQSAVRALPLSRNVRREESREGEAERWNSLEDWEARH